MAWRIRHSIAKRRGRALIASILAVLFLVLAPTAGAAIVSGINSKLPQVSLLELDDQITQEDTIFTNTTNNTVTVSGVTYSSDIADIKLNYHDVNGTFRSESQSYTVTDDSKIFLLLSNTYEHGGQGFSLSIRLPVTAEDLKNSRVSKMRLYVDLGSGVQINPHMQSADGVFVKDFDPVNITANGSWIELDITELDRLTYYSKAPDTLTYIWFDTPGQPIPSSATIDLQLIGPESGGVGKNWLNIYFALGGIVGLVGAVFATPYVNIRSFRKAKHKHTKQFRKNKKRRSWRRRRR